MKVAYIELCIYAEGDHADYAHAVRRQLEWQVAATPSGLFGQVRVQHSLLVCGVVDDVTPGLYSESKNVCRHPGFMVVKKDAYVVPLFIASLCSVRLRSSVLAELTYQGSLRSMFTRQHAEAAHRKELLE